MPGQSESIIDRRSTLEVEHRRGGMGPVWKARDLATAQPVALKILHGTATEKAERFAREASLLADLTHEGIVAHVAHGTTPWLHGENVAER